MRRNWALGTGIFMFGILLFFTIFGSKLPFVDPNPVDSRMRFYEDGSFARAPFPPSSEDFFGTDRDGRDLASLIIIGTKDTLRYIFIITFIRYIIAVPLGFLASNKRGLAYTVSSGWNSLFASIPTIFAAILLMMLPKPIWRFSDGLNHDAAWILLILALMEVGRVSYLLANDIHEISEKEYVKAGIVMGNGPFRLYKNYYLPNVMQSLIINFFNDLSRVTLLIGQLALFSYFIEKREITLEGGGMDILSAAFDWQALLESARGDILTALWIPVFPALAIAFTIFTFNLLGEGLRQRFDLSYVSAEYSLKERLAKVCSKFVIQFKKRKALATAIVSLTVLAGSFTVFNYTQKKAEQAAAALQVEKAKLAEANKEIDEAYKIEKDGSMVAVKDATTKKGGLYDSSEFIGQNMTPVKKDYSKTFEDENFRLVCPQMAYIVKCSQAVFYFKKTAGTPDEALNLLREHLPEDIAIAEKIQANGDVIYNATSENLRKSHPIDIKKGFSITFKFNEKKAVYAAVLAAEHKKADS